jgi:histone H3/H4
MSSEISQLSLKRLFNRAGIRRVKHDSYNELSKYMTKFTQNVLNYTITLVKNRKNQTINEDDLKKGLIVNDVFNIIGESQNGGNYEGFCHGNPSQCSNGYEANGAIASSQTGGSMGTLNFGGPAYCHNNATQCSYDDFAAECGSDIMNGGSINDYIFSIPNTQFQRFLNTFNNNEQKMTKRAVNYLQFLTEQNAIDHLLKKKNEMENNNQKEFDLALNLNELENDE